MSDRASDMRHILSQIALVGGGTVLEAPQPKMTRKSLGIPTEGLIPATPENIERARSFVFKKWVERFHERFPSLAQDPDGPDYPRDLSSACKFTSLFARTVFGGRIRGNEGHQFVEGPDGQIIDLNADAADVKAMASRHAKSGLTGWHEDSDGFLDYHGDPHQHDPHFLGNPDHLDSMRSVEPRVRDWVEEFMRGNSVTESVEPARLDEKRVAAWSGGMVNVLHNPNRATFEALVAKTEGRLRGLLSPDGNDVYLWPGYNAVHVNIMQELALGDHDCIYYSGGRWGGPVGDVFADSYAPAIERLTPKPKPSKEETDRLLDKIFADPEFAAMLNDDRP